MEAELAQEAGPVSGVSWNPPSLHAITWPKQLGAWVPLLGTPLSDGPISSCMWAMTEALVHLMTIKLHHKLPGGVC